MSPGSRALRNLFAAALAARFEGLVTTWQGLQPKRWYGPKVTRWRPHRTEKRLVIAGHERY